MQLVRAILAISILFALIVVPARTEERIAQRAVLYEEEPLDPGVQNSGKVVWCLNRIRSADGSDDVEILGKVDIPLRRVKMTLAFRRNADASLPASHVIELRFNLPADFSGGGVGSVPGMLMKTAERARGAPLMGLSVKVTDGFFMIGLSNQNRANNVANLTQREWIDLPMVYKSQQRGILAIEKGATGHRVFQAAFAAWQDIPSSAEIPAPPGCSDQVAAVPGLDKARSAF